MLQIDISNTFINVIERNFFCICLTTWLTTKLFRRLKDSYFLFFHSWKIFVIYAPVQAKQSLFITIIDEKDEKNQKTSFSFPSSLAAVALWQNVKGKCNVTKKEKYMNYFGDSD